MKDRERERKVVGRERKKEKGTAKAWSGWRRGCRARERRREKERENGDGGREEKR